MAAFAGGSVPADAQVSYASAFEDEQRCFTQCWPGAQHLPWQQTVFGPHAVLAQQVSFRLGAQNGPRVVVMQHFLVFGQHSPAVPQAVVPALHLAGATS
ncbi:MAG: hypothetical protein ACLP59_22735 [Bryobacteraceae bacterium]